MARAIDSPSLVLVPRPSSSMMVKLFSLTFLLEVLVRFYWSGDIAYLRMKAISRISSEKVDIFASMLSSVDILTNSCWIIENDAYWAGTKQPICAITCKREIIRMCVLFPLILHPVMT